ncbi:MAG: hypothetical protein FI716_07985 [SAR202 cluster bacterium]|nr:hypothetical protein [SAR202 cluster bacterium]
MAGECPPHNRGRTPHLRGRRPGVDAFSLSGVSYVSPAREVGIGIGIGVVMGVFLLKEPFGGGMLLGFGFIVGGLVMIALSP